MSTPRTLGVALAWLVSVAVATAVAMLAIGAIGNGIAERGPRPLSQSEVDALLTSTTVAPETSPPAPTTTVPVQPTEPSTATPHVLGSAGGTVLASCTPGVELPRIVSATPAQGYHVESIEPEDGGQRVRFRTTGSGHGNGRIQVYVRCDGDQPISTVDSG